MFFVIFRLIAYQMEVIKIIFLVTKSELLYALLCCHPKFLINDVVMLFPRRRKSL